MTMAAGDERCAEVRAALAGGGADVDWEQVEAHLATCPRCAAGLVRFSEAVAQQFAASDALAGLRAAAPAAGSRPPLALPTAAAVRRRPRPRWPRYAGAAAAAVAVAAVLTGVFVARSGRSGSGGASAVAERLPQYVSKLYVLPPRADNTYVNGDEIQVCINVNQPSRVVLQVLEGHTTTTLLDTDADASTADRCFPYRVAALRSRATLRLEAYYGPTRIAREDVTL